MAKISFAIFARSLIIDPICYSETYHKLAQTIWRIFSRQQEVTKTQSLRNIPHRHNIIENIEEHSMKTGGVKETRTLALYNAIVALYQLSYNPITFTVYYIFILIAIDKIV